MEKLPPATIKYITQVGSFRRKGITVAKGKAYIGWYYIFVSISPNKVSSLIIVSKSANYYDDINMQGPVAYGVTPAYVL
jgi:hypothetical protein